MRHRAHHAQAVVPLCAFAILLALSFIDWEDLSGSRLSNFDLFGDLGSEQTTFVDSNNESQPERDALAGDSIEFETDSSDARAHVMPNDETSVPPRPIRHPSGMVMIEDYTADGNGLEKIADVLNQADSRIVRIAVVGDSYIEGDIFTQDLRRLLQTEYGGRGIGYMPVHTDIPGFRKSVAQSDCGWEHRDLRQPKSYKFPTIVGEYCISTPMSEVSFSKVKSANGSEWSHSRVLILSKSESEVVIHANDSILTYHTYGSPAVQMVEYCGLTDRIKLSVSSDSVIVFGVWLDGETGVSVDCMSIRGNSGIPLRNVSQNFSREMRDYIDYDLVILEFGMNALSTGQVNYDSYGKSMSKVVEHIRSCYPDAELILMGVGDRGERHGSAVSSMVGLNEMVAAQRSCARRSEVLFWDTREAMGGENAITTWRERGLVNGDFIHLNHRGGAVLAEQFVKAMRQNVGASDN